MEEGQYSSNDEGLKNDVLGTDGKYGNSNSLNICFVYYFKACYKHTLSTCYHSKKSTKRHVNTL